MDTQHHYQHQGLANTNSTSPPPQPNFAALTLFLDQYFADKIVTVIKPLVESYVNERLDPDLKRLNAQRKPIQAARRPALNNFGQESYDHLLTPYLPNIVKSSNDPNVLIQKIVMDLFFHPEHKKNHNIYIAPGSYQCITVYKDNSWKNFRLEPILEKIARRANDVLQHYIIGTDATEEAAFRHDVGKKKFEMLKEFTDKIDNLESHEEFGSKLFKDIEHVILTFQHTVHRHLFEPPNE